MIYFVRAGRINNPVKIGYTTNTESLAKRLIALQTGNPEQLHLLLTISGNFDTEKELHDLFSAYRIRGEWFNFEGRLRNCISGALNKQTPNVTNIRTLQQAGLHFKTRIQANRKAKQGKPALKHRINKAKRY